MREFTAKALQRLVSHSWDGNVRELENVIERAVVLCQSHSVDVEDLPQMSDMTPETFFGSTAGPYLTLEELEKRYIGFILEKTGGKKEKAAQILGCNRRTLYRKEREYGFVAEDPAMESVGPSSDLLDEAEIMQ